MSKGSLEIASSDQDTALLERIVELQRESRFHSSRLLQVLADKTVGVICTRNPNNAHSMQDKGVIAEAINSCGGFPIETLDDPGKKGLDGLRILVEKMAQRVDLLVLNHPLSAALKECCPKLPVLDIGVLQVRDKLGKISNYSSIVGSFLATKDPRLTLIGDIAKNPTVDELVTWLSSYPGFALNLHVPNKFLSVNSLEKWEQLGIEMTRGGSLQERGPQAKTLYVSKLDATHLPDHPAMAANLETMYRISLQEIQAHTASYPDTLVLYPAEELQKLRHPGLGVRVDQNPSFKKQDSLNIIAVATVMEAFLQRDGTVSPQTSFL